MARKSYKGDVLFHVVGRANGQCLLKGLNLRLLADAPENDLIVVSKAEAEKKRQQFFRESLNMMKKVFGERVLEKTQLRASENPEYIRLPGRVLHLDGDQEYLNLCLEYYRQLGVPAVGYCVGEELQAGRVEALLHAHRPDLLVLTGHDAMFRGKAAGKLSSYRHSADFAEAVGKARKVVADKDGLVIFAGACQSHFEALMEAGANFASSPERIFIHPFDPLFIMQKVAYTSIGRVISPKEVLTNSVVGLAGIGGVQTRGKLRLGLPKTGLWQKGRRNERD